MGASCCHLKRDDDNSFHQQSYTSGGTLSACGLGFGILSPAQDIMYIQSRQGERITIQPKIDVVRVQEPEFIAVSDGGTMIEGVEPHQVLKSIIEKHQPADCKLDTPDACVESRKSDALPLVNEDEDFCPTCLEGYDNDNPKIITQCKHHYHLSCILEWMERSDTCPICDVVMVFNEPS